MIELCNGFEISVKSGSIIRTESGTNQNNWNKGSKSGYIITDVFTGPVSDHYSCSTDALHVGTFVDAA